MLLPPVGLDHREGGDAGKQCGEGDAQPEGDARCGVARGLPAARGQGGYAEQQERCEENTHFFHKKTSSGGFSTPSNSYRRPILFPAFKKVNVTSSKKEQPPFPAPWAIGTKGNRGAKVLKVQVSFSFEIAGFSHFWLKFFSGD